MYIMLFTFIKPNDSLLWYIYIYFVISIYINAHGYLKNYKYSHVKKKYKT